MYKKSVWKVLKKNPAIRFDKKSKDNIILGYTVCFPKGDQLNVLVL